METPEKTGSSRVDSLVGIIKAFLKLDPMMGLIALLIIVPLAIPIIQAVLAGDLVITLVFVALISGITLLVYIPLIVVRTWQKNQREISTKQQDAIDTEAKIRLKNIDTEAKLKLIDETNKQKRFNDVANAKIESLKAQVQFILDQSDRHERALLKQISEDLGKHFKEGISFVDKEECSVNVSKILEEFNKVHMDYDEVFASVGRIESALKITKEEPPEIQIVEEPDKEKWEGIAGVRQNIIEDQLNEIDGLKEKNESQAKAIREMEAELHPEKTPVQSEQTEMEFKEAIKAVDNLKEVFDEPSEKELEDHFEKQISDEPLPEAEIDKHLQELEQPLNYWTCKYCNNTNPLKVPRCKKCGKGKAQPL